MSLALLCVLGIGKAFATDAPVALQQSHPVFAQLSIVSGTDPSLIAAATSQRLACVMGQLGTQAHFTYLPWRRAHQELHQSRFDGAFPAMAVAMSHLGQISAPVAVEQWFYYGVATAAVRDPLRADEVVGVQAGSLQESWLRHLGHASFVFANTPAQLLKLVRSGRVARVLASASEMDELADQGAASLSRQLYRYVPVALAFSRALGAERPQLISAFNQTISKCYQDRFDLPLPLREALTRMLSVHFKRWQQVPGLSLRLSTQSQWHRDMAPGALAQLDTEWQTAFHSGNHSSQTKMLDADLTQRLKRARTNANGMLNAVWVLDAEGKMFASSDAFPRFDYQGSVLFQAVKDLPDGEHFIGQVMYSETFHRAQVLVGIPLRSEDSQALLGVMGFAVDLDVGINFLLDQINRS